MDGHTNSYCWWNSQLYELARNNELGTQFSVYRTELQIQKKISKALVQLVNKTDAAKRAILGKRSAIQRAKKGGNCDELRTLLEMDMTVVID